ncbi:MAG: YDG/SRA domain-containing protein [Candidatus Dormibacteria bacterium]
MPPTPIEYGATETPVGATFPNRQALRDVGLHRPLQAGIDFAPRQPAASVVLSGVYPDEDRGDVIIYTGQGGQDPTTGKAIADQKPARGNAALFRNRNLGIPVRVLRRVAGGFQYDGLFSVEGYFRERPASDGFLRWKYTLHRIARRGELVLGDAPSRPATRVEQTVQRIVRDTRVTRRIKEIYSFTCQVCDLCLPTPVAPYAEAAHIRPLGQPHHGKDVLANVLCLCPNDHVLFDFGAITISPETLVITGDRTVEGRLLAVDRHHEIDAANLDYHREAIYVPIVDRPDR